jgi:hypothetical protein
MYVIGCRATNGRGRVFPYSYARLAGASVPIGDPIPDAVVLAVPLASLTPKGGLFAPLANLVAKHLSPPVMAGAARLTTQWEGATLGPFRLGGVSLISVYTRGSEDIGVSLGLEQVEVDVEAPQGWVPHGLPDALRRFLPNLGGKRTIQLGKRIPLHIGLRWSSGEKPRISVSLISGELAMSVMKLQHFSRAIGSTIMPLLKSWNAELQRALNGAAEVFEALEKLHKGLEARLSRVGALLPPLPAIVSPSQPSVCLSLSLSSVRPHHKSGLITLHLTAKILGVIKGGKRCADLGPAGVVPPLPLGGHSTRRLAMGPPSIPKSLSRPAILVSHDLLNAYLAAVWASGALDRVPIRIPDLAEQGFDIRSLAYRLPPVLITAPDGRLRLELPELGVDMGTLGEPRRLFAAHLRIPLGVETPGAGRLRLGVDPKAPPKIHLRCEEEAAGRPGAPGGGCPAQSKRFQSLVNIATDLALRPELATPPLAIEAALPAIKAAGVSIGLGSLAPLERGIKVNLEVKQAK